MPVERVNSEEPRRSQPSHFPAVAQFTISSPLDSPAVHCASLRAMRWCSQTVDSISGLEHQDLNSLAKIWRHHEIPHFALTTHFCSGCIVNLDGPCRVQQLDHQRHVRLYNPRNSFPSGRVYPTH